MVLRVVLVVVHPEDLLWHPVVGWHRALCEEVSMRVPSEVLSRPAPKSKVDTPRGLYLLLDRMRQGWGQS